MNSCTLAKIVFFGFLFPGAGVASLGPDRERPRSVLFLAGPDTHAWGQHKHFAGSMLLAESLRSAAPGVVTEVIREWPDPTQLGQADVLVIYADGHQFHPANTHLAELEEFMDGGKGVVAMHWATGIGPAGGSMDNPSDANYAKWRSLVGAGFEPYHAVSRIWTGDFDNPAAHPIMNGVAPFALHDECYFHLRVDPGRGISRLLESLPPTALLEPRGETFAEGNTLARRAIIDRRERQFVAWAFDRPEGGRAFGFTGGHFHWTWARDEVRKMALNGIAWAAGYAIPEKGLASPTPTARQMLAHLDAENPGWTEDALQLALDQSKQGQPFHWKDFENKPLPVLAPPVEPALKAGNAAGTPRRSPEEQLGEFVLADGFTIELVASEAQGLEKPVALNFDEAGRLWTMTATEYPLDLNDAAQAEEARRKWKDGGRDRILVIDDPLLPGPRMPRVFAEGLVMPMSVLPWKDGVIVAHGPEVLFLRDTDGDRVADRRETLLKGFGVQDSHTMAHQLMWLPDGSVFVAQGVLNSGIVEDASGQATPFNYGKFGAFRPDGTGFRIIGAGLNNTWGVLLQRTGGMWVQEANSFDHCVAPFEEGVHYHGWHEEPYIPGAPWQPGVGEVELGSTGLSGLARSEDREGGFPPRWQDVLLIANAVTGAINSVTTQPTPEGGWKAVRGPDLLTCRDRRFRPVHIAFGPDACLYIVDWYNPVISHNEVPRDHAARDKTSGRIWRVRHASQTERSAPNVLAATNADLIRHVQSPNTWESRAAWRQIVERKASDLIPALGALLQDATVPEDSRCHVVWCLVGLRHFDAKLWREALTVASQDLAVELIRALRVLQPPTGEAVPIVRRLAGTASMRLKTEIARYYFEAPDVDPESLAIVLSWMAEVPSETVKGVQGGTLSWAHYPQAFLNMWLQRVLAKQISAVEKLAMMPERLSSLPPPARTGVERAGHAKRFETGGISAADLGDPGLRSAAFACAESFPHAASALREWALSADEPKRLAAELLDSDSLTPAALKTFAAPLALRLLATGEREDSIVGLDLAAIACAPEDSARLINSLRGILAGNPDLGLQIVRCATTAGIRDAEFYEAIANDPDNDAATRAAAWPGWFESVPATDRAAIEAALREWCGRVTKDDQSRILGELASTTVGAHFVLNNAFAALLEQDEFSLPRIFDELSERIPEHGRLPQVRTLVVNQRAVREEAVARRGAELSASLGRGSLKPNPEAGRVLFSNLCLSCHSAGGRGSGYAPPLEGGAQRDLPGLLHALLDPAAAVENVFRPFQIRLRDGTQVEGFLKSRRGNRLLIEVMGGTRSEINLLRVHTARHIGGHSLMPSVAERLTDQEIADLVGVVRRL